jgi:peptidyl-prolyl cis-trans isomerase B (cyclophilin B)
MKNILFILSAIIGLGLSTISCSNTNAQENTNSAAITEEPTAEIVEPQEQQKEQLVKISTEYGDMVVKLYNETPLHRDNFIKLAKDGFYDGTIFHRVIKGFMIQGGDPESKNAVAGAMYGNGGPGYTIPAEFNKNLFHKKGALAAARLGDNMNPTKASSGSQFYIVEGRTFTNLEINTLEQQMNRKIPADQKEAYMKVGGTPFLDMGYTVFGEVVSGMEVIDKIAAVKTLPGDRPAQDVKMTVSLVVE